MLLDPVDGKFHRMLVTIEELRLVAYLRVCAIHRTRQNNANARAILVAVDKDSETRDTARSEVNNVGGTREHRGLLPVHRITGDHTDQCWNNILIAQLAQVFTRLGIINRDHQRVGRDLNAFHVFQDVIIGKRQVRAMEWRSDGEESVDKADLPLGERNTSLVQASRSLDLTKAKVETIERNGRSSDDKVPGTVDKRYRNMPVSRQMLVRRIDVLLNRCSWEISYRQHGSRDPFSIFSRVLES
ncbi:hypothetical protein VTN96DRAFT_2840 [Rasamsonia emersonii]